MAEAWQARNTQNDAAWIYANNPEVFTKQAALDLVSSNLEELLGLKDRQGKEDAVKSVSEEEGEGKSWVAWEGDLFGGGFGRARAVKSVGATRVDLF